MLTLAIIQTDNRNNTDFLFVYLQVNYYQVYLQEKCMHYFLENGKIELKEEIGMTWKGI